jgi:SAM-dependent methyltransferase
MLKGSGSGMVASKQESCSVTPSPVKVRSRLAQLYGLVRDFVRRYRLLYMIVRVAKYGPFMGIRNQRARKQLIASCERTEGVTLYLGSGGRRQRRMVNLDITPVTGPDVVADGYMLPFRSATFDAIFCDYVIEHVPDPERFLTSAVSSLKPSGFFYLEFPFIQPLHGQPSDFTRWSRKGFELAAARCGLNVVESGIHSGPAFTVFWLITEWLAILLSGGIQPLLLAQRWLLRWLFAPLLILDILMFHIPCAEVLASGFYFVGALDTRANAMATDRMKTPKRPRANGLS